MTVSSPSQWKIILAFGLVYLFWGSTYLGIGIAVEQIPPAYMCATRFMIAGLVMLAYCAATGRQIRFSAQHLFHLAVVGFLHCRDCTHNEAVAVTRLIAVLRSPPFVAVPQGFQ